ncbi:unnamed protein product [Microthlaspi erraticum]|uniref:Uncharacterized protein n=1 Tax=Microthlaspi erraticum TaxID=1685480 RepID=A0A6D2HYN5_9BRAS|nr:unnamed protein product [Microthlaspi erraticum]
MLSKAKKGSHIRTRDNMGFEMKRLSAPQRTGRLGRGLEMVDGHQEHSTHWVRLTRSSLRLLFFLFFIESVWLLGLGGAGLLEAV